MFGPLRTKCSAPHGVPGWLPGILLLLLLLWTAPAAARTLAGGESLLLKLDVDAPAEVLLSGDGRCLALSAEIVEGEGRLRVESRLKEALGEGEWTWNWRRDVDPRKERFFTIEDLPRLPTPLPFTLRFVGGAGTVRLEAVDLGAAPEVTYGDAPGELLLRDPGPGAVSAVPEGGAKVRSATLRSASFRGVKTSAGDVHFLLPAGVWRLTRDGDVPSEARLVPVSSGVRTVLDWPSRPRAEFVAGRGGRGLILRAADPVEPDTALLRLAGPFLKEPPALEDVKVFEGGRKGEVLEVRTAKAPLSVVLALDSSGSMKRSMKPALDAAMAFVRELPPDAAVRVLDFDTKVKPLKAADRKALLAEMVKIKADGATALRDAVVEGLKLLADAPRPALVLFTDGFDANYDDTGPGSKIGEDAFFKVLAASSVPVYSIGFGAKSDEATLRRVAERSGGEYRAADEKNVADLFSKVAESLSREFEVLYRRPKGEPSGSQAVVALMIDNSGSMSASEGRFTRMDAARSALHRLVDGLPEEAAVSVAAFTGTVRSLQSPTHSKASLHQAVSSMAASGGTDILKAVRSALEELSATPAPRKYLFFLSDAAMNVGKNNEAELDAMLGRIRDEGIFTLWISMEKGKAEEGFKRAAALSGGAYVLGENHEALLRAVEDLLKRVRALASDDRVAVEAVVKIPGDDGLPVALAGSGLASLPAMPKEESQTPFSARAGTLSISFEPLEVSAAARPGKERADAPKKDAPRKETASPAFSVAGAFVPFRVVPLGSSGRNEAVEITAGAFALAESLDGVRAPSGKLFLALSLSWKNLLAPQEVLVPEGGSPHPAKWVRGGGEGKTVVMTPPYLVQDMKRHLFLRWGAEILSPSEGTWLLDDCLGVHGRWKLLVPPEKPVEGALIFVVSDKIPETAALDLYDTAYGMAGVPLLGAPEAVADRTASLPHAPSGPMGAFTLRVDGMEDVKGKLGGGAIADGQLFRVLRLGMTSEVQALLDFEPRKGTSLEFPSEKGTLRLPPSPVTEGLPGAFYGKVRLAPGSFNAFRQAYVLPALLADAPSRLRVELKGEDLLLPLSGAAPESGGKPFDVEAQGVALRVNDFAYLAGSGRKTVFADVTVKDLPDGFSTRLGEMLFLAKSDGAVRAEPAQRTKNDVGPDAETKKLLFGWNPSVVVPDGADHRALVLFRPGKGAYRLASPALPLSVPLTEREASPDPVLLSAHTLKMTQALPPKFEKELLARVEESLVRRAASGGVEQAGEERIAATDGSVTVAPPPLAHPVLTEEGAARWSALLEGEYADLLNALGSLRITGGEPWRAGMAPAALLLQGSAGAGEAARMAEAWLLAKGAKVARKSVPLTSEGRAAAPGWSECPVLEAEKGPSLVLPFMKPLDECAALIDFPKVKNVPADRPELRVEVVVFAEPKVPDASAQLGSIGSALGGSSGSKLVQVVLADGVFSLADASLDAFDIIYTEGTDAEGKTGVTASVEGVFGRIPGKSVLDTREYRPVRELIRLSAGRAKLCEYVGELDGEMPLTDRMHTVGALLPDLPEAAAARLEERWKAIRGERVPAHLSVARWYTRSRLYAFLAASTKHERDLAGQLGVTLDRSGRPRLLLLTIERDASVPEGVRATIDLRDVHPDVRGEKEAAAAFRIVDGLFLADLEAAVLSGKGVFQLWQGSDLVVLPPKGKERKAMLERMKKAGLRPELAKKLEGGSSVTLFPVASPAVNGTPLVAWLDIDPVTYETTSVFESGERGAFAAEVIIQALVPDGAGLFLGFMVGVDAAVWSVAAFTLEGGSYESVLERAENFASGIAERFDKIGEGPSLGPIGLGDDLRPNLSLAGWKVSKGDGVSYSPWEGYKGFVSGYKAGVATYFANARKKK